MSVVVGAASWTWQTATREV